MKLLILMSWLNKLSIIMSLLNKFLLNDNKKFNLVKIIVLKYQIKNN